MTSTKPSLEEVTGYLGVGALLLLGIFFIIDGFTNFWITVEQYAKTASFAILFTVPLLVICYVLGLLASLTIQALLDRFLPLILNAGLFAAAAQKGREALLARYLEVERHSRLLYGCTLAFLLLALGSLAVQKYLPPGQEAVSLACLVVGVVLATACPVLARHLQQHLRSYVSAFESHAATAVEA